MKNYLIWTSDYILKEVKAKSKLEALKMVGYVNIYWKGNTPYSYDSAINKNVFAILGSLPNKS